MLSVFDASDLGGLARSARVDYWAICLMAVC